MPFFYFDYYYLILVVPALLIALWAQFNVKSTFNRYRQVRNIRGYTGSEVARRILDSHGLYDVRIERVSGSLSDHYDPRTNVVRLSDSVYNDASVAALGVAAHEVGHAIQHNQGYLPLKVRSAIIPVTQLGSSLAFPLAIFGLFLGSDILVNIGILLFVAVVFFQLVTLPVEFNASNRALAVLESERFLEDDELSGAKRTLRAAALTYVAALIVAIANLLRLLALVGRRRD